MWSERQSWSRQGRYGVALVCWLVLAHSSPLVAQQDSGGDLAEKLVLANRILALEGLVGPYGHVSVRAEREGSFLLADHRSPGEVKREHIKEVPVEVSLEEVARRGLYRETLIHSTIYQQVPEVRAVVHTHAPYAVALGTLEHSQDRVLPTTNPGANLGNFIPVFRPVGLIGTAEKGIEVARALQGQNGVLLRGHGTVTVGNSLEQAVLRAIYLEFEARSQMWSRGAGEPIFYHQTESDLFKSTRAIEHAWHYYVDKVLKIENPETAKE